ncbi:MAG: 30S ribosome-binding factor RbfA [Tannerellaceae bacterium]|jgi:ribosome-binding factor A|nr:30S ribosome-binding factor RbfA [Tannerellaceae bacterium]
MEGTRLNKVNRLLQKELGILFQEQTQSLKGTFVSVSTVRVSPDLGLAKVYLSLFPQEKASELMNAIRYNTRTLRYDLGQRIGKQLRKVPELVFFQDDSLDYIEHIDELLQGHP